MPFQKLLCMIQFAHSKAIERAQNSNISVNIESLCCYFRKIFSKRTFNKFFKNKNTNIEVCLLEQYANSCS
jgi:hypothetical protein